MPNLNKVMIMGNLTRDPELKHLPNNNMAVVSMGVAVNRQWTDRTTNEKREETTFVDCEAFARTAEVINQYMKKGSPIYIEGRLKLDQWQDRETGGNRSKLKVIIENFQFLDSRREREGGESYAGGPQGGQSGGQSDGRSSGGGYSAPSPQPASGGHQPVGDDDIPF